MSEYFQPSGAQHVVEIIHAAEEIVEVPEDPKVKPQLLIERADPNITVAALRDLHSKSGKFFDRGVPVILSADHLQGGVKAQAVTPERLILVTHDICRPYVIKERSDGSVVEQNTRLPDDIARMYLAWQGEWKLPPLHGISSTPMLSEDGSIHSDSGYDHMSRMWCENIPDLSNIVPANPTIEDAKNALYTIRNTFKTFCFADARTLVDPETGVEIVDINHPPGVDESGFLVALLTAVARPSLQLAPGVLIRAPSLSGAGAGKGLLARCICKIAFGKNPYAVTAGQSSEELEKRISAELIEGSPAIFLDNLNNRAFKSDQLASAITEDPARVRVFGKLQMVPINTHAFILLTGNGLTVSEDLARRFVVIELDPRTENPEARAFSNDILAEVTRCREELLAACLTIWRWGRLQSNLNTGTPLGSFEQWSQWVRDPLQALGCQDPANRVVEAKQQDVQRQQVTEIYSAWWDKHGDRPTSVNDLCEEVKVLIDPQLRSRQYLSAKVQKLAGTRIAGFVLIKNKQDAKWTPVTYTLKKTDQTQERGVHRGHQEPPPTDPTVQADYSNRSSDFGGADLPPFVESIAEERADEDTHSPYDPYAPYDPHVLDDQNLENDPDTGWSTQI